MLRVAWFAVVSADVNTTAGDDRGGMCLRAHLGRPLDVFASLRIKRIGQTLLGRDHVARPGFAPLRLVRGGAAEPPGARDQAPEKDQTPAKPQPDAGKLPGANTVGANLPGAR